PIILQDLPFFTTSGTVQVPDGRRHVVLDHQIIVWVSLAPMGQASLDPSASRFPAILDTGSTFTFSLREEFALQWTGFSQLLPPIRTIALLNQPRQQIPVHPHNIWPHPNLPGGRDQFSGQPAVCLPLNGIAVYPKTMSHRPRLPLLGLRGLAMNRLRLEIDADRLLVSLLVAVGAARKGGPYRDLSFW